jgi:hypothetical protein
MPNPATNQPEPRDLVIELRIAGDRVYGIVRSDDEPPRAFNGVLGLLSIVDAARTAGTPAPRSDTPNPP